MKPLLNKTAQTNNQPVTDDAVIGWFSGFEGWHVIDDVTDPPNRMAVKSMVTCRHGCADQPMLNTYEAKVDKYGVLVFSGKLWGSDTYYLGSPYKAIEIVEQLFRGFMPVTTKGIE